MPFNLNEFKSSFNTKAPAKSSDFEIRIFAKALKTNTDLVLRAEAAEVPGRSVTTSEYRDIGPVRKLGYGVIYPEINIRFVLSDNYEEKKYFDRWLDGIVGSHRIDNSSSNRFSVGYYDDYVGRVEIINYDSSGLQVYKTTLIEAYPLIVSPVSLDWGTSDIAKLNVSFAYRNYEHEKPVEPSGVSIQRFSPQTLAAQGLGDLEFDVASEIANQRARASRVSTGVDGFRGGAFNSFT